MTAGGAEPLAAGADDRPRPRLGAFIINLDRATERWSFVERRFSETGIPFRRISATEGRRLQFPIPEFSERSYRLRHGRRCNPPEVGCYLSHLECMRRFLESDLDLGLIAEDDADPVPELRAVVEAAIRHQAAWDVLRLSGYHDPHPLTIASLGGTPQRRLCVPMSRLSGAGAYLLTRRAAEVLLRRLVPMRVPFDHALDREWCHGLRAAMIDPLPVAQMGHEFASQIPLLADRLPSAVRYWTVLPYRAFNEGSRIIFRLGQWFRGRRLARRDGAA